MDQGGECGKCLFLEPRVDLAFIAIYAEVFRPFYMTDVAPPLQNIAEPCSRPEHVHCYRLTPYSLASAVSAGVSQAEVVRFLKKFSYVDRVASSLFDPSNDEGGVVGAFVAQCMSAYNKATIVHNTRGSFLVARTEDVSTSLRHDKQIASLLSESASDTTMSPLPEDKTDGQRMALSGDGLFRTGQVLDDDDDDGQGPAEEPVFMRLKDLSAAKYAAKRCTELGYPLYQHYDYSADPSVRDANIILKAQTKPRPYQIAAVASATSHAAGCIRSGVLVLPCGAGKTLVGILAMAVVKKVALVVCASSVAVEQWKTQILDSVDLLPSASPDEGGSMDGVKVKSRAGAVGSQRVACLTGKTKDPIHSDSTDVVITTYAMVAAAHRYARRQAAQANSRKTCATGSSTAVAAPPAQKNEQVKVDPRIALFQPYGLLVLDEVHVVPADFFKESLAFIDAKSAIGLTATYVREDHRILELFHLVGPKLFDISWEVLCKQGFLASVNCVEVHTPMTQEFAAEYIDRCFLAPRTKRQSSSAKSGSAQRNKKGNTAPLLTLLAAANPNKMLCVQELIHRHSQDNGKILVFCDHIMLLKEYAAFLGCPYVCGETAHKDRLKLFSDFQSTTKLNVVCISRVGDVSVNLPAANVVIQVSSHGGSRRQEAQRLGRILRPKERTCDGRRTEAYFYSIVSRDTYETVYAARRTQFLLDLGYSCRCATFAPAAAADETNAGAEPLGGPSGIGDVAQVKREQLFGWYAGGTVLRPSAVAVGVGKLHDLLSADCTVRQRWTVSLLAKVVASWELQFAEELRDIASRKRARNDEELRAADVVEGTAHAAQRSRRERRTVLDIKEELLPTAVGGSARSPFSRDEGVLADLTTAAVDIVYHEF